MQIEILGTESLGVRGLSCVVRTHDRSIVIDPGLALGFRRHSLLPHPFQVAAGENVQRKIVTALRDCSDIVISHFHGDHMPLAHANPFQLSAQNVSGLFRKPRLWCKSPQYLSPAMKRRCNDLSRVLERRLPCSEGLRDGPLHLSRPMPHGEANTHLGEVMMTRIEDSEDVFVHASDIQLLDESPVEQILDWKPSVLIASGPPLYLGHLSSKKRKDARDNALLLAAEVPVLILDHHMLRSEEGYRFLEDLSSSAGKRIFCAADYMKRERLPLEAWRQKLYLEMPVPEGWHKAYALGISDTAPYRKWRDFNLESTD